MTPHPGESRWGDDPFSIDAPGDTDRQIAAKDVRHIVQCCDRYDEAVRAALADAREQGRAEMNNPCRFCGSPTMLDGLHIWGRRKWCPDCDHRAVLDQHGGQR